MSLPCFSSSFFSNFSKLSDTCNSGLHITATLWSLLVSYQSSLLSTYQAPPTSQSTLSHFTAKQYTTRCFWKHITARNRHYSNRILIHIWSALPSLTVWSEFASDWQLLIDGRLQFGSDWLFSSGMWNLADAIRSTGGHTGTWFFSDCLSHALLSGYSDRFIKITFFNHICSISAHCCFK